MRPGAGTPEELDTLLEDAFVTRDRSSVAELFEDWALLADANGRPEVRGRSAIGLAAIATLGGECPYVANPARVLQARRTALVIASTQISVALRGDDGAWRYAITLLNTNHTRERTG
jgi:hypothetical protein